MKIKFLILSVLILFTSFAYWDELGLYSSNLDYVPWEVIVKYKDTKTKNTKSRTLSTFDIQTDNLEIKENLDDTSNIALVEIIDSKSVQETIDTLNQDPNIEYAEPNYIRYLFSLDNFNDTYTWQQRWLDYISRAEWYNLYSWILQENTSPIVIGIIDNWVNYNHSDLIWSMWETSNCIVDWQNTNCVHWYDFYHNTATPLPNADAHGTHIAWIIAAWVNNWTGIIWVNPYAKIAALKIWRWKSLTSADEIRAINFAIQNGIKIINASYGSSQRSNLEKEAIENFWNNWGLFVTAAGNWNSKNIWQNVDNIYSMYPCNYDLDNIICVAALDTGGNLAYYSNYWINNVDVAAPWTDIMSTIINWTDFQEIMSEDFEDCTNEESINWDPNKWNTGSCYHRNNNTTWYQFSDTLLSPAINMEWKHNIYLSFAISCNSQTVQMMYLSGWTLIEMEPISLWTVNKYGSKFTFDIPSQYYTSGFQFQLSITSNPRNICAIDDVEIYEDPYVDNDNSYWKMSWTSMATPFVVWLASLVWMINPELSTIDVKNLILDYWDENSTLINKTVSWKSINVKKTLIATFNDKIWYPTNLHSSRSGDLSRTPSKDNIEYSYHYEILDQDYAAIQSGDTLNTWFESNITWNYTRRIKSTNWSWQESEFFTGYICERPILNDINLSWYECSSLTWIINYNDNCSDTYEIIWTMNGDPSEPYSTLNTTWTLVKEAFIRNSFWEESNHINVNYERQDSLPTLTQSTYNYPNTITSSSSVNINDIIWIFWVKEWMCWSAWITIQSVSCSNWNVTFNGNSLSIIAPTNQQWSSTCEIIFQDDEWNQLTWNLNYNYNTIPPQTSSSSSSSSAWWSSSSGGWSSNKDKNEDKNKDDKDTTNTWDLVEEIFTWKIEEELEKPRMLEILSGEDKSDSDFDFSWFNKSNPEAIMNNWYTVEFNNAYEFAHRAWITTIDSIEKAKMNSNLTRVAMSKMLSQYAINILWKQPDTSKIPYFPDVRDELDSEYNNGVTLAYQLWIMWVWINNFRPHDTVTRAEFWTALSRMLYWTDDWQDHYYSTHLAKLYNEWIINNTNPTLKELRWYVMIMLMRSVQN